MEDEAQHFLGKVAQKAIIEKDGKVLLTRFPTDKKWDLPGGRIHGGERPTEALQREIMEELGVEVIIKKPVFVGMTKTDATGEERYFVAFAAELADPKQTFTLQEDEVAEVRWVGQNELNAAPIFDVCREAAHAYFRS